MIDEESLAVLWSEHKCMVRSMDIQRESDQRALELQARVYEVQLGTLEKSVNSLTRLVYIGLGVMLTIQVVVAVWPK